MLFRKFTSHIEAFLRDEPHKILLINGARQIGKSYLIRYVCKGMFRNYIELNLKEDKEGVGLLADVRNTDDFYIQLGAIAGERLGDASDTIVFLDEIQSYPHLMTMLKFLNEEGRYRYIASGSELGIALAQTPSIPIGSIAIEQMFPLDFEEFLLASGCGKETIDSIRNCFLKRETLNDSLHTYMLRQFKIYLLTGGMPDAVNKFLETRNIALVRKIQNDIHELYRLDASQYDSEKKLVIRNIYDLIPSNMENKKKRVVVKKIENTTGHKQFSDYADEFEYLTVRTCGCILHLPYCRSGESEMLAQISIHCQLRSAAERAERSTGFECEDRTKVCCKRMPSLAHLKIDRSRFPPCHRKVTGHLWDMSRAASTAKS